MTARRRTNGRGIIVAVSLSLLAVAIVVKVQSSRETNTARMTSTVVVDASRADSLSIERMVPIAKRLIDAGTRDDAESEQALDDLRNATYDACKTVHLEGTSCEHELASRALNAARDQYFRGK